MAGGCNSLTLGGSESITSEGARKTSPKATIQITCCTLKHALQWPLDWRQDSAELAAELRLVSGTWSWREGEKVLVGWAQIWLGGNNLARRARLEKCAHFFMR